MTYTTILRRIAAMFARPSDAEAAPACVVERATEPPSVHAWPPPVVLPVLESPR